MSNARLMSLAGLGVAALGLAAYSLRPASRLWHMRRACMAAATASPPTMVPTPPPKKVQQRGIPS
jgi:hypothetical protein